MKTMHFSTIHYQKIGIFHSLSLFHCLEKKSEIWNAFTYFENEKWNENALKSRSRMKSEMKRPWNRDREWKVKWKCLKIETEKWNFKIILENSRETRLSQVTVSWSFGRFNWMKSWWQKSKITLKETDLKVLLLLAANHR